MSRRRAVLACAAAAAASAAATAEALAEEQYETWRSVFGMGDPAAAREAEQDRRAAMLLARQGAGHWPACGG